MQDAKSPYIWNVNVTERMQTIARCETVMLNVKMWIGNVKYEIKNEKNVGS